MPDSPHPFGVSDPAQIANQGSTVAPRYGARCPMMYHLFAAEMDDISTFNGVALTCFGVGNFLLSVGLAILINGAFYQTRTELGEYLYSVVSRLLMILSVIPFIGGAWALLKKKKRIERIKEETKLS